MIYPYKDADFSNPFTDDPIPPRTVTISVEVEADRQTEATDYILAGPGVVGVRD